LKEEKLFNPERIKANYVSFKRASLFILDKPNQLWEADYSTRGRFAFGEKSAYIKGKDRRRRIFNFIGCFTRRLLLRIIRYFLPSSAIVSEIEKLLKDSFIVRTDNGPEFRNYRFNPTSHLFS